MGLNTNVLNRLRYTLWAPGYDLVGRRFDRLRRRSIELLALKPGERVVIVGGGISGLAAAWKLARSGFTDFRVLDLEPRAGGTAMWGDAPVTAYPWGAHYLPVPGPRARAARELLRELNGHGSTICMVTHDSRYAQHADREVQLFDGRVVDSVVA